MQDLLEAKPDLYGLAGSDLFRKCQACVYRWRRLKTIDFESKVLTELGFRSQEKVLESSRVEPEIFTGPPAVLHQRKPVKSSSNKRLSLKKQPLRNTLVTMASIEDYEIDGKWRKERRRP